MNFRALPIVLLAAAGAAGQSGIGLPRAGCFSDDGGLRAVTGIAGNFVLLAPEEPGVMSAACSGDYLLIKTAGDLELRRAGAVVVRASASEGPAMFAFSRRGDEALAYLPATSELFRLSRWGVQSLGAASVLARGEVLSLAWPRADEITAVLRTDGGAILLRTSLGGDRITETELPGVEGPALLRPDGVLIHARESELIVVRADGEERMALPAPAASLDNLGERFARIVLADGGHLAFEILDGIPTLYALPEVER